MTFAESKDQVARKANYKGCTTWDSFKSIMNNDGYEMQPYYNEAAELYAASVREEGKTVNHSELADAVRFHHDPHDNSPEMIAEYLLWKFDIRKKVNDDESLKAEWVEKGRDSPECDHLNNGL